MPTPPLPLCLSLHSPYIVLYVTHMTARTLHSQPPPPTHPYHNPQHIVEWKSRSLWIAGMTAGKWTGCLGGKGPSMHMQTSSWLDMQVFAISRRWSIKMDRYKIHFRVAIQPGCTYPSVNLFLYLQVHSDAFFTANHEYLPVLSSTGLLTYRYTRK